MVYELLHNSRTIGADNPEVATQIKALYSTFCQSEIVTTTIRTAEMTKVVENTFRDINIAYANELTKICRRENMDVYEIIRIANKHPRVNILSVDPWFLVGDFPDLANLIWQARKINDSMPEFVLERIHDIMIEQSISDTARVGLYGLTYKEDVDDVRESPSLQLLECMSKHLAPGLKAYDPWVERDIVANQYHDFDTFLQDVDMVVIMVSHTELRENMIKLQNKVVLDTRKVCELPNTYRL
jgi:UDP-N-acetyl-D-mannosaminuronic acid dehydrogenase